jgi:hypothetical protein
MKKALHRLVPVAALVIAVGLVKFADEHRWIQDLTRNGSNTLHEKSIEILSLLPDPIAVTAYVPEDPALRSGLADFFARYQRRKPGFTVNFTDPRTDLAAGNRPLANLGEVWFAYGGRRERLSRISESAVTNALARLARGSERWITFLANNGERRIAREANHDLTRFAENLERRGLRLREYTLGRTAAIPDNTAVLVLASPSVAYLPSEADEITRFVAGGGNLLWLAEPDAPPALSALEHALGVRAYPGTVVDPVGLTKLRNPAYAVALDQAEHPIFEGFNQTIAFPYAAALHVKTKPEFSATVLARTQAGAWTETGALEGNVGFDGAGEIQGELVLAVALSKASAAAGASQRIVVIGDGDFLSNMYVENLGNLEFGRRTLEWLAEDDALIDIAVPEVLDTNLDLAMWQRLVMFLFFCVGLPLILVLNGAMLWRRRRYA